MIPTGARCSPLGLLYHAPRLWTPNSSRLVLSPGLLLGMLSPLKPDPTSLTQALLTGIGAQRTAS